MTSLIIWHQDHTSAAGRVWELPPVWAGEAAVTTGVHSSLHWTLRCTQSYSQPGYNERAEIRLWGLIEISDTDIRGYKERKNSFINTMQCVETHFI